MTRLKAMKVGETQIFTERLNSNPGAAVTSKASESGIIVTTQSCWITVPKSQELVKAVIVTKCQ
jgi:hypothetical protein